MCTDHFWNPQKTTRIRIIKYLIWKLFFEDKKYIEQLNNYKSLHF